MEEQGRGARQRSREAGTGAEGRNGESPVRLSFKLFAGETRVSRRRFARRREALTGSNGSRGVYPVIDTHRGRGGYGIEWEDVGREDGSAGRRRSETKDNTEFEARSHVFHREYDFLSRLFTLTRRARPSRSIRANRFSNGGRVKEGPNELSRAKSARASFY